jgi:hypothetical protein
MNLNTINDVKIDIIDNYLNQYECNKNSHDFSLVPIKHKLKKKSLKFK